MKQTIVHPVYIPISCIDVDKVERDDLVLLPPNLTFTLRVRYPIHCLAKFKVKSGKRGMSVAGVVRAIGRAYREIYATPEDYGVWGHCIEDLLLVDIRVDLKDQAIEIEVDS